jgi:hypothetical protein
MSWLEERNRIAQLVHDNPDGFIAGRVKAGGINRTTDLMTLPFFAPDLRHWDGDEEVKQAIRELKAATRRAYEAMAARIAPKDWQP